MVRALIPALALMMTSSTLALAMPLDAAQAPAPTIPDATDKHAADLDGGRVLDHGGHIRSAC